MIVGYARTSTVDQVNGYDAQIEELKREGCEKIFGEQVSSVAQRAELDRALEFIREGDILMVTRLDRLARSVADLCAIEKHIAGQWVKPGKTTHTTPRRGSFLCFEASRGDAFRPELSLDRMLPLRKREAQAGRGIPRPL